jgi:RNA polymerase sigma factor for flagellar operon FliA
MIISEIQTAENTVVPCSRSRESLILEHLPQVSLIAKRMQRSLPASVSLDDLISSGTLGLIAAIDRYNPEQGVKLKTYAEYKIRGAILDSLRINDWAPREKRKRARMINTAIAELERDLYRRPREEEVAGRLGIPVQQYREWLKEAHALTIGSLDSSRTEKNGKDLLRFLSGSIGDWPSELYERSELERLVIACLEKMPLMEQRVLRLYFFKSMTLREIAKIVGLHESRISQLKSHAISRLRAQLQEYWPVHGAAVETIAEQRNRTV